MLNIDLRSLARALGGDVRSNQVLAPGPGHSATDRSLAVKLDDNAPDGFVVHSFAHDDPIACRDYVRTRAGLPAFAADRTEEPPPKANGAPPPPKANGARKPIFDISRVIAAQTNVAPKGNIVATFDYVDDKGALLYQVVKYEPKDFRQRRPDGKGGWVWSVKDCRRAPYRLTELLKYPDGCVFVCEGEKDADRVAALDHCATTVACGDWTEDCIKALAGRDALILRDMDQAGHAKALKAAQALNGTAKTIRVVELPGLDGTKGKKDVSDWLDLDSGNAAKLAEVCFDAPLWTPSTSPPPAATATPSTATAATAAPLLPLPWIDISNWDNEPVPLREWAVEDRIPLKQPYLFTGHGAVGKSLVELMRACAHVLDKYWLGMKAAKGPVIYMGAEDDKDELHRRLYDILNYYGASFADVAGGLHLLSYVEKDGCMLGVPNRQGIIEPTPLFRQLEGAAMDIRPVSMMIDTVSDVFGGNENDRGHVTQFIKMLQGMAVRARCSVSILAHPSNAGLATGSGISGSTGWHNKVRARAYMRALETPKGEEPEPDLREIQFLKNNYGRQGDSIQIRWQRGIYILENAPNSLEKLAQDQRDDDRFLELLAQYESNGRTVGDAKTANNYAVRVFAKEKHRDGQKISVSRFEQAMQRLFTAHKIHVKSYGRPSQPCKRIALGPRGD